MDPFGLRSQTRTITQDLQSVFRAGQIEPRGADAFGTTHKVESDGGSAGLSKTSGTGSSETGYLVRATNEIAWAPTFCFHGQLIERTSACKRALVGRSAK
jgi:hypothetical protein